MCKRRHVTTMHAVRSALTKELHIKLFDEMNQVHKSNKFTMNHTSLPSEKEDDRCQCKQQVTISTGRKQIEICISSPAPVILHLVPTIFPSHCV